MPNLIGTAPNQVPTNGSLGNMAFQNKEAVSVDFLVTVALTATNATYTGTLTGGTGIVNLGSGQFYKDANGNVGIGTITPAAKFDVTSTTSGFLPPRMSTTQRDAISSPPDGSVIYNNTTGTLQVRQNGQWVSPSTAGVVNVPASLDLDFINEFYSARRTTKTFNQLIDFTRTSAATYVDAAGKIVSTPASRNLLTFTQEFDNAGWTKTNATVTANAATAPDGTLTADVLVAAAGASTKSTTQAGGSSGVQQTFSVYAKAGTSNFIQLWHGAAASIYANFNIATGVVGTVGSNATASITSVGNGWYRCAITCIPGSANQFRVAMITSGTSAYAESWTAVGTETVFIWGAQLEAVPDANLVLGSELRSTGTVGFSGTATAATYNTSTGDGSVTRVDISNQSFVSVSNLSSTATYRVAITVSTGAILLRVGTSTGTALATLTAGTHTVYVVPTATLVFASSAGTSTFTLSSIREFTGTTGMPTDYTRNNGGVFPPRFDYDPVTLAPRGLLVEEQRTNLFTYSEQFDNGAWSKATGATVTANATTSPDGTADADKLVETATTGIHFAAQAATTATSTAYTFSIYLKSAERSTCRLYMGNSGGTEAVMVDVDTTAGTLTTVSNAGTNWTSRATTISNAGNGWWRVTLSATNASLTSVTGLVYMANPAGTIAYTGDGTSGIFIWGAQLEAGAFATSYIPTVASQVTRTADVATITGANFSQWYNQSEGTFVAQYSSYANTNASTSKSIFAASDGTTNNRIYGNVNSSGVDFLFVAVGGVAQANISTVVVIADNAIAKFAGAYKANDFAAAVNGGAVATDTSGSIPTVDRLSIGNLNSFTQVAGHIRSIQYYNTRLSNAQLQALTT